MNPFPKGTFCLSVIQYLNLQTLCFFQISILLIACLNPYVYVNDIVTLRDPSLTV